MTLRLDLCEAVRGHPQLGARAEVAAGFCERPGDRVTGRNRRLIIRRCRSTIPDMP